MSSITVRKDLRGRFGPVRDQGVRPTCLAFAASDAHAATREPWAELCCEYLFETVAHLRQLGIRDRHLEVLESHVRARCEEANAGGSLLHQGQSA